MHNGKNVRDAVADGGGILITGISAATKQEVTAYIDAKSLLPYNAWHACVRGVAVSMLLTLSCAK